MARPILHSLTGIRFLAALHVILYHLGFSRLEAMPAALGRFIDRGLVAVSFFFVLSGFVLTYRYAGVKMTPLTRQRFLVARVARVYPLYLLGLLAALPSYLQGAVGQGAVVGLLVILGLQAWLPQAALAWNFPSWSLSNEAFFYAIFPRVLKTCQGKSKRWLMGAILALWVIGQIPSILHELIEPNGPLWSNLVTYFPLFRLPEFLIGVAVGVLFVRDSGSNLLRRGTVYSLIGAASSLVIAFGFSGLPPLLTDGMAFLGPAFALLTYGLALGAGPLDRVLANPFSLALGDASYAMYLLHVPIARLSQSLAQARGLEDPPGSWGFLLLVTVAVVIVALPVNRYFEKPARRIVRDWGKQLEPRLNTSHRRME